MIIYDLKSVFKVKGECVWCVTVFMCMCAHSRQVMTSNPKQEYLLTLDLPDL